MFKWFFKRNPYKPAEETYTVRIFLDDGSIHRYYFLDDENVWPYRMAEELAGEFAIDTGTYGFTNGYQYFPPHRILRVEFTPFEPVEGYDLDD